MYQKLGFVLVAREAILAWVIFFSCKGSFLYDSWMFRTLETAIIIAPIRLVRYIMVKGQYKVDKTVLSLAGIGKDVQVIILPLSSQGQHL